MWDGDGGFQVPTGQTPPLNKHFEHPEKFDPTSWDMTIDGGGPPFGRMPTPNREYVSMTGTDWY
jgi:hypothetical protein